MSRAPGGSCAASPSRSSRRTSAASATTSRPCRPTTRPTSSSARTTGRASSRRAASSCRSPRARRSRDQFPPTPSTRSRTAPPSSASTARRSGREHRPRGQHQARQGAEDLRRPRAGALAFKKKKSGNLAIAVQQGANGDAYHMYPFFSGLCGYVFGKTTAGNARPVGHRRREQDVPGERAAIDRWNRNGLINSKVDDAAPLRTRSSRRRAAFWVTGPWNADRIRTAGDQVPDRPVAADQLRAPCRSSACRASWSRSSRRRTAVESSAKDLVGNYMMTARRAGHALAAANGRYPANIDAGKSGRRTPRCGSSAQASKGGVPMPNIPQMAQRLVRPRAPRGSSRRRAPAPRRAASPSDAARNIANKIG